MRAATGLVLASLVGGATGCAAQGPSREQLHAQIGAYHHALTERDQRLMALSYQYGALARDHAALAAHLQRALRAQQLVTDKLAGLVALNERVEAQLQATEQRLKGAEDETGQASDDASDLETARLDLMRQLGEAHAARTEAMKDLARTVQYLVDTGQLQVSHAEGEVRESQSLDIEDPWRYR